MCWRETKLNSKKNILYLHINVMLIAYVIHCKINISVFRLTFERKPLVYLGVCLLFIVFKYHILHMGQKKHEGNPFLFFFFFFYGHIFASTQILSNFHGTPLNVCLKYSEIAHRGPKVF